MSKVNRYQVKDGDTATALGAIRRWVEAIQESEYTLGEELDLTDLNITPYSLWTILEKELGYEKDDLDSNGWQMDFCITMVREGFPTLFLGGCGINHEVTLSVDWEEDWKPDLGTKEPSTKDWDKVFDNLLKETKAALYMEALCSL